MRLVRGTRLRGRESGQAAVESALTLPLLVFMILGTLQLFMLFQGRVMTQYAAYRATRAGSVNHGDCIRMKHAAIAALLPTFVSFLGAGTAGGSAGAKLGNAFQLRQNNRYSGSGTPYDGSSDNGLNGPIVWIFREAPNAGAMRALAGGQDRDFDQPGTPIRRLEVRLVYWMPLRIPFADWVMTRIVLAQWGVMDYTAQNPMMQTQQANWTSSGAFSPDTAVKNEMAARYAMKQYVFPIQATSTMRMMTPAKANYWVTQDCIP